MELRFLILLFLFLLLFPEQSLFSFLFVLLSDFLEVVGMNFALFTHRALPAFRFVNPDGSYFCVLPILKLGNIVDLEIDLNRFVRFVYFFDILNLFFPSAMVSFSFPFFVLELVFYFLNFINGQFCILVEVLVGHELVNLQASLVVRVDLNSLFQDCALQVHQDASFDNVVDLVS